MRCQEKLKADSYDQIDKQLFGRKMKLLLFIISTICFVGVSIGSIVYLKNVIVGIIMSFSEDGHPLLLNTTFWAILFCEGIMLPLSCMPRMKGISYISSFTSVLPLVFLLIAIPHYFLNGRESGSNSLTLFAQNPNGYLESFSILTYPLIVDPNFLTIFSELINPTKKRKMSSLFIAFFSEMIIYSAIAYFNYLHFSRNIDMLLQE